MITRGGYVYTLLFNSQVSSVLFFAGTLRGLSLCVRNRVHILLDSGSVRIQFIFAVLNDWVQSLNLTELRKTENKDLMKAFDCDCEEGIAEVAGPLSLLLAQFGKRILVKAFRSAFLQLNDHLHLFQASEKKRCVQAHALTLLKADQQTTSCE